MRINLFGGPGSGKSTLAAYLFAELKMRDYSVELVTEFVKLWAYLNRIPKPLDQIYILAKQLDLENTMLSRGVKTVITDSPLLLTAIYAKHYGGDEKLSSILEELSQYVEGHYPSLNIWIDRSEESNYSNVGRFQEDKDLLELDKYMKRKVYDNYKSNSIIEMSDIKDKKNILDKIIKYIEKA